MEKDKIQQIEGMFRNFDGNQVPGACINIIQKGDILFKKAYGMADLENYISCTLQTNFRLASVTKQFTAMSIMILAERNLLNYENRLIDFFPDFPKYGESITLRQIMNHISGLPDYEKLIPEGTTIPVKDKDVLELVKTQVSGYVPPGTQYKYSNTGYAILSLIVEKVSGLSFREFLKKNIFEPVGMKNTIAYEEGITSVSNRAYGYSPVENTDEKEYQRTDQSITSAVLGDGGIYSSVEDLYYWDQILYGEKLISQKRIQEAFTSATLPDGKLTHYGFGWYVNEYRGLKKVYHSGSTIGFKTAIQRYPEKELTFILLFNRYNVIPLKMIQDMTDLICF